MDVDSYLQCLNYMDSIPKVDGVLDITLKVGVPIGTFILGFVFSWIKENRKESKEVKNKKICVDEEIHRVMQGVEHSFKECVSILDLCRRNQRIESHRLPPEIEMPCIETFFWGIAHEYTQDERHYLSFLGPNIKELNVLIQKVREAPKPRDLTAMASLAYAVLEHAPHCYAICETLKTGVKPEVVTPVSFADKLQLKSDAIDSMRERYSNLAAMQ
ncbi:MULTISPECIES: hypothetical protein [Pseudomonas]|uniref:hypothetical protein n=1 Tax=Pseudomonas TaxID=286 RepID=UPI00087D6845|nr:MULTISPECIES: hypothetical protein [Pseudomonas]AZD95341.1 hypothetical protein C4K13_5969 [Pseudomonas chlororaphis subsp. aureofaciens]KAB0523055.1 hypothetical protein F7R16_31960 [Pseudomonas chlororaphis subsp. aureofaciens]TSD29388.1 hypothetical protein FCE86_007375 [Pseudomonas sp. ATCC 13985]WDG47850.1 hypothetical protein PUP58_29675 [Pseudomonas chlororaphis]WDG60001.1 hypothetical protein PUP52_30070 [Pseudomonas chlororaphis]